jgi:DNA polymerase-3 subunit alpha
MSKQIKFDCGCSFDYIDGSVVFSADLTKLNLSCEKTWDLISAGNTKGCFQLESRLGQMTAKKLKPQNIEQLSALIAIIRPGCLEAVRDGKSVTDHYIDKKNGLESVDIFHPALGPALLNTYGEMIYQEQAMQITRDIAGFDLKEADMLRKAIGKKKPEEMSKIKTRFLEGCSALNIVSQDEAEEIFSWIEKSQRYSFNKSHSISYAMNGYLSAYAKAHFPKVFFASYLKYAKDKIDPKQEIKELVKNASEMDISVKIPDLRLMNRFFEIHNDDIIFGLTDIKGVGQSIFDKLELLTSNIDLYSVSWPSLLLKILVNINSTAAKAIISSGAIDFIKKNRTEMLFDFENISQLTTKEIEKCIDISQNNQNADIISILRKLITESKITTKRKTSISSIIDSLLNPPYSLIDKIEWLSDSEDTLLGCSITCSKLDTYDISMTNSNCKQFKTCISNKNIIIAGEIININTTKTKRGKTKGLDMAFVSIEDQFGILDSVVLFPEQYQKYKHQLFNSNILIFVGNKNKTGDGLIVDKCFMPAS